MTEAPTAPLKVLVVDDDRFVLAAVARLLRACRFEVTAADSVQSAIDALAAASFDVVVSDVSMPGGGGIALVQHTRAAGSQIPFVFFTGYSSAATQAEARALGVTQYLAKPLRREALYAAILAARAGG